MNKAGIATIDLIIKVLLEVGKVLIEIYIKKKLSKTQVKETIGVFKAVVFRYLMGSCARIDKTPEECDCISDGVLRTPGITTENLKNYNWRRSHGICPNQEHMTPISYLADMCFDCIYNNIKDPNLASKLRALLEKHFKVCWITKSEAKKLDQTKCSNGRKLSNYMPNQSDPYSRYKAAGIKFHEIDIKKTWQSPNPKQQIFVLP
ncbi:MAG: hypothetical protein J6W37_08700 [Bacteroidales bacterium]|nr:hypothetical protein [Bacteroidales bacterium]